MTTSIFIVVLLAAVLHAAWNAVIKIPGDALVRLTIVNFTGGIIAMCLIPIAGLPDIEAWPYIGASLLIHTLYHIALLAGYRTGDLSFVYPIARGVAPVLIATGGYYFVGEQLSQTAIIGLLIASIGIISIGLIGQHPKHVIKPFFYALLTGLCIASYSLVDGLGGRLSNNVFAYITWLFFLDAIPITAATLWLRQGQLTTTLKSSWKTGLLGGCFAFSAYGLVIWAMSNTPMSEVSAVRETSVVFATLIGVYFLGETMRWSRVVASLMVAGGVMLMQL